MPTTINLSVGSGETKNLTFNCGGTFVPDDIQFVITGSGGDTNTTLSGVAYCSTGASTTAKVATMPGFALSSGQRIILYLSTTNSKASATLNVNSTGDKTIKIGGANTTTSNFTSGYWVCEYDGTNWNLSRLFADVKQDDTTTSSYRKVILSGNTYSSAGTTVSATTGQTYATQYVEVQPSTGKIRSKGFVKTGATVDNILLAGGGDVAQSSFASSGHEHSVSLVSGGTSTVNLAANTAYTLTVGGSSIVFKTPSDNNNNTVTTGKSGVVLGTTGVAVVQQDGTDSGTVALPSSIPSTWLGTSSTTAATGNHTHTTTVATSTGTSQITLAYETKYSITAGGTSYVFTTPSLGTSATTAAAGNHTHTTSLTSGGTSTISLAANTAYTLTAGGTSVIFKTPADNNNVTTGKSGVVLGTTGVAVVQKDGTDSGTVALPSTIPSTWLGTSSTTAAAGNHTHSNYLTSHQTIKVDGVTGATTSHYGTCSTAAGTAAKAVTVTGTPALEAGLRVIVKFTTTNSAGSPTLNVNSLGAKSIYYRGSAITGSSNNILQANRVYEFVYDGTYWQLVGDIDTNTNNVTTGKSSVVLGTTGVAVVQKDGTDSGSVALPSAPPSTWLGTSSTTAAAGNHTHSGYLTSSDLPSYSIVYGNSTSTSNTANITNSNLFINLVKNSNTVVSSINVSGTGGITVTTPDDASEIQIDGSGVLPSTIPSGWLGTSSTTAAAGNHTHSGYLTSHQTIKVDGVTGATTSHYGTCGTAAGTATKVVSVTGTPTLEAGLRVIVKFTTTNTASSPKLNVNSLGAKSIYYRGSAITGSSNNILQANRVYEFVYDGSYWQLVGDINTNSGGTVTSVGLSNATNGGLTISGSPVTGSGTITVGHTNVLSSAQTTQAVYPIAIDKNGHISSYGTAVTIPTYGIASGNSTSTSNTSGVTNGNVHLNLTKNEGSGASVVSNVKMEGTSGVTVYTDESGDIVVDGAGCSGGGGSNSGVAYCNTAASNGAKEAILPGFSFDMSTPFKSHSIILYVANTNTYNGTCTLNVNGTCAGSMRIETYDSYGSETWSYVQGGMLTKGYYFCNFNGNSNSEWYIRKIDTSRGIAFCDSSGSTNKKIASFEGFSLRNNTIILITFSNSNTASSNVTLNVDGTGAFPLYVGTDNIAASSTNLPAGEYVATFVTPGGTNLSRWIVIPFKKAFGIGGEIVCTNSASSTANTSVSSGDVYLNYVENGSVVDSIALHGMGGTTITSAVVDGYTPQIRISSTTGGSGGGATYLSDLTDVESSPLTGNVLQFNGTIWTGGIAVTNVVAGSGLNVTSGDTTTDGGQIGYLDTSGNEETISSTGTIHLTRVNTANSYNGTAKPGFGPTADKTVTSSSNSFYVPYYQVDKFGRVTGSVTRTITINGLGGSGGGSSVSAAAGESMNRGYLAGKITVDNVGTKFIVPPARSVLGGGSQYDYTSQGLVRPRVEYDMTYLGYSEGSSNELSLGTSMNSNLENLFIFTEAPDPSNGKRIALLPIVTVYYRNAFNGRMEAAPFLALDFDVADGIGLFNGYYNVLIPKNK